MTAKNILFVVVPCYNEQEVLIETAKLLSSKMIELINHGIISKLSKIVFINDGSKDDTWNIIKELHKTNPLFSGINLACNRGHQNALLAGLMQVKDIADVVISMDADLQDDINAIDEMLERYYSGCDIVYGVRNKRLTDTKFKRITAEGFYKVMNLLGANTIYNHADYRLMSKRALNGMAEFKEVNLFLRGIVPMIGYKTDVVYYERKERFAGESKYPLRKMLSFALQGITSLSIKPIRIVTYLGVIIFITSLIMLLYSVTSYFSDNTMPGWASVMVSVWGIGGLQLLSIGIIGEYIGKIYLETKHRPRYIIEEFLHDDITRTDNENN